jgi:hypothetical protein
LVGAGHGVPAFMAGGSNLDAAQKRVRVSFHSNLVPSFL